MTRATRTSTKQPAAQPPRRSRWIALVAALCVATATIGCTSAPKSYGREAVNWAPKKGPHSIAVAPAVNLSGQRGVDPLLQADIVYQELQQIRGLTVVPVNRSVQVMAGLNLHGIDSVQQAYAVCDALGVEALLVPTISAYDPYDPPKFGGSVQIFLRRGGQSESVDVRALARQPTADRVVESMPTNADFIQAVRMFDAAAGTTRQRVEDYAEGRVDPSMPLGVREFYLNMDRYSAFAWHELINEALEQLND